MLLAGDEVLRTQLGNNNAWCQDNELSWFDWRLTERHSDMLRFTRELIAFRRRHPTLWRRRFLTGQPEAPHGRADVAWHGLALDVPPWADPAADAARVLAFTLAGCAPGEEDLHVILNFGTADQQLPLPARTGPRWHLALDTAAATPGDLRPRAEQSPWPDATVGVRAGSVVVLEAR
jgi:glycogen operon protein